MSQLWWDPGSAESVKDLGTTGASGVHDEVIPRSEGKRSIRLRPRTRHHRIASLLRKPRGQGRCQICPATVRLSRERIPIRDREGIVTTALMRARNRQLGDSPQPWIRDWTPWMTLMTRISPRQHRRTSNRYKRVPEASVWVAQAEGLLAKLIELESASPSQRPSNRELTPQVSDSVQGSETKGTGSGLRKIFPKPGAGEITVASKGAGSRHRKVSRSLGSAIGTP